jgi:glycosyltransferase involved in cell wall biosynthesis
MKIAFIIQRYGIEIIGGAEYFTRLVAEQLKNHHSLEILTTCAKGYHTWENDYPHQYEEINGVKVRRFKNQKTRNMGHQMKVQELVFYQQHSRDDEINWIDEQGPFCPDLIEYITEHKDSYDLFVFFTYRYYPSYNGIGCVGKKSVIVPFAENDPALSLTETARIFNTATGIIYSTPEERKLINTKVRFNEKEKIWDVIGCGIDLPQDDAGVSDPVSEEYILYLGRIEGSKGCYQLFEYYLRLLSEWQNAPDLVLAGFDAIGIPAHEKIRYIGFVSEERKATLLKNAKILVMPSPYESFSLVTLESLAFGTPVLVNGECEVLKGHCIRSNAGLWYQNFDEFKHGLSLLVSDSKVRDIMKKNGPLYIKEHYSWDKIIQKYLVFFKNLESLRS